MNGFHMAEPAWEHALWGVLALALLGYWLERRGGAHLERFLSASMQKRLVSRPSSTRRSLRLFLTVCATALLVLALMRPQWGLAFESVPSTGSELMICLDVSKSMLAEDVAPNRLERAKADLHDLLDHLDGNHAGLIAFAGKATVLCPMTPDFGFLRMVLDEAGPGSVARGGTSLSAPILKAVDGFGPAGDVARTLLLITDGEDHDSFPVEAAKKAAENGIRICAIGFGDEAGSEVYVTDPKTGARTLHRDREGSPVRTRLDGDTLREIVQATDGVYIPAGTGVLDIDSIYKQVIAKLHPGALTGRGRPVYKEGFQWAVLVALIALLGAVTMTSGRVAAPATARALGALVLAAVPFLAGTAYGDEPAPAPADGAAGADATEGAATGAGAPESAPPPEPQVDDPRALHNLALGQLEANALDEAERGFESARRAAGIDGTTRYQSTYNLGWVFVKRADAVLESKPEEALGHYQAAAAWFRDAARLRPDETDPRHNLEVVNRRALELADSLAKKQNQDLPARLDALIELQRAQCGAVRDLVAAAAAGGSKDAESLRPQFRELATAERQMLADAGKLTEETAQERDALEAKKEEERTPEEKIRRAQLEAVLHYMHRSSERLGQTRQHLRQKSGERAARRAAAALQELKRARDQLRDPVAVLGAIIADATELGEQTATHAAATGVAAAASDAPALPPWLTIEYLQEAQDDATQRTVELHERLRAGVEGWEAKEPEASETAAEAAPDPAEERTVALVRAALPHLQAGREAFERASAALAESASDRGATEQRAGILALLEAREQFLDLRGLIELLYRSQRQVEALLESVDAELRSQVVEMSAALAERQTKDVARGERLRTMVDDALAGLPAAPADTQNTPPDTSQEDEAAQAERRRLDLAIRLLPAIQTEMTSGAEALRGAAKAAPEQVATRLGEAAPPIARAAEKLGELRRLFFTIVEHLKDTLRRQVELADDTADAAAIADPAERSPKLAPLVPRQEELGAISGEIGRVLGEQATAGPPQGAAGAPGGQDPQAAAQAAEMQEKLARAAELVTAASGEMSSVAGALGADAPDLDLVAKGQKTAEEQLTEAILLLEPPRQEETEQDDKQSEQPEGDQDQQESKQPEERDASQQLQAVRDREAKRRAEKERGKSASYEPVDKDW